MKVSHVKWIGLIGAILSGFAQCVAGDFVSGAGVVAAALSSAGVLAAK